MDDEETGRRIKLLDDSYNSLFFYRFFYSVYFSYLFFSLFGRKNYYPEFQSSLHLRVLSFSLVFGRVKMVIARYLLRYPFDWYKSDANPSSYSTT